MKRTLSFVLGMLAVATAQASQRPLKLHAIFTDHMVLQRGQPIVVWGWADAGDVVSVTFGNQTAESTAEAGRWEVTFPAREASAEPHQLTASVGTDESITLRDIVIGDVWVANGQSNMAWSMRNTTNADFELPQANMPLLRHFRIKNNEQATLQSDIRADTIENGGWEVSTPEAAIGFSAIGYAFGSRLQRALNIPIGVICNARGGASIESMVPTHQFDAHPVAQRYAASVAARQVAFGDGRAKALEVFGRQLARAKRKNLPEAKWPTEPQGTENLRSWDIPGQSPSDAASCYNGMFGVFKGLSIKGALFHQGYNNAMNSACRPERYRVLMRLMVEGWRQDFGAQLPIAVIGFCAGGDAQNEDNFEELDYGGGPYIRESQRLGLQDVGDPKFTAFLPAYDVKVPGLHPRKKRAHGLRAARWALSRIYGMTTTWDTASLVSAEPNGDEMVLTFDKSVQPDDLDSIPRGFSIAGADGKFYRAHARYRAKDGQKNWRNARSYESKILHVWSPLVAEPVAVRYGWATSPLGNLKVNGHPDCPLPSFRTDDWDWPESDDPDEILVDRGEGRRRMQEAIERCEARRLGEAQSALRIYERLRQLGRS